MSNEGTAGEEMAGEESAHEKISAGEPAAEQDQREQMARVRERFTRTAGVFSEFVLSRRTGEAERLAALVAPSGTERTLDLACGPGTLARVFSPCVLWVCGLDLTLAMLGRAQKEAADEQLGNFQPACGNALLMPFRAGIFDLVVTSYSIHHMAAAEGVIREAARVLRPGGKFGLLDIIVPENPAHAENNNAIERSRDNSHTRTLPAAEFERLLAAAGLRLLLRENERRLRSFDDWMRVAGWQRGDDGYESTRKLLEASLAEDVCGFAPRLVAAKFAEGRDHRPDIEISQQSAYFVAQKQ